jgi:hypothetical protein
MAEICCVELDGDFCLAYVRAEDKKMTITGLKIICFCYCHEPYSRIMVSENMNVFNIGGRNQELAKKLAETVLTEKDNTWKSKKSIRKAILSMREKKASYALRKT